MYVTENERKSVEQSWRTNGASKQKILMTGRLSCDTNYTILALKLNPWNGDSCKNQQKTPIWTPILLQAELWEQAIPTLSVKWDVSCICTMGCYCLLTNASCKRGAKFLHHRLPTAEAHFTWEARLRCRQVRHGTKHKPGCSAGSWACTESELLQRSQQEGLALGALRSSIQRQQWWAGGEGDWRRSGWVSRAAGNGEASSTARGGESRV